MYALGAKSTPFVVPNETQRKQAIGPLAGEKLKVRKALGDPEKYWKPVPTPQPGDWLHDHDEDGQTYDQYKTAERNVVGNKEKTTLYIKPLQPMPLEFLEKCYKFSMAFFYGMPVKILPVTDISKLKVANRINEGTKKIQYHAGDLLKIMQGHIPKDSYAMLCIIKDDLYPRDSWNFVYGMASITGRTGVFSFARYYPDFYGDKVEGNVDDVILYRACKVMSHEMGHMFGIKHCVHYSCSMNGSNHEAEASTRPLELCPVCLRKLQLAIDFDPQKDMQLCLIV